MPHRAHQGPVAARSAVDLSPSGDAVEPIIVGVPMLARVDVLVIDEMGYLNLKPEQTNIFFKLMEERYRRKATIITTNLEYDEWPNFLGNKSLVDALINRLQHRCHTVRINGPSLRTPETA